MTPIVTALASAKSRAAINWARASWDTSTVHLGNDARFSNAFSGQLIELSIYNAQLSKAEVARISESLR